MEPIRFYRKLDFKLWCKYENKQYYIETNYVNYSDEEALVDVIWIDSKKRLIDKNGDDIVEQLLKKAFENRIFTDKIQKTLDEVEEQVKKIIAKKD